MLTLVNEPDDGLCVTLARVHDVERHAPPIPVGELVRIVGLIVDGADRLALWSIAWRGSAYYCLPSELRPLHEHEAHQLQETC
jgi:hypothetical protein